MVMQRNIATGRFKELGLWLRRGCASHSAHRHIKTQTDRRTHRHMGRQTHSPTHSDVPRSFSEQVGGATSNSRCGSPLDHSWGYINLDWMDVMAE